MKEVLVEGHSRRGRPLGRWKDRVKEYMCERKGHSRRGRPLGRWKDRVKEYMCEFFCLVLIAFYGVCVCFIYVWN